MFVWHICVIDFASPSLHICIMLMELAMRGETAKYSQSYKHDVCLIRLDVFMPRSHIFESSVSVYAHQMPRCCVCVYIEQVHAHSKTHGGHVIKFEK